MLNFLGSLFGKIASAVTSVFVAIGLVSAPASVSPQPVQPPIEEVVVETVTPETAAETEKVIDVKAEIDKLKEQLAEEQKRRKDLEKKITVPAPIPKPAPAPVVVVPTPAPIPAAPPPPPPAPVTPAVQLLPGQFLTPSGAIVDSTGKVVKPAPVTTTATTPSTSSGQATTTTPTPPPPPPAPTWPPPEGSTVDIKRSIFSVINFNTHLSCDQLLSLPPSSKDLCKLYKENESNGKYTWHIIEDL